MFHTELQDRWNTFTIHEQMANIGAEVGRCIAWKEKGNEKMWTNALYRALELIDLTKQDPKHKRVLGELCRLREVLLDHLVGKNMYQSTNELWDSYFLPYNFAARKKYK